MKLWTKYKLKKHGISAKPPRKVKSEGRFKGFLERSHLVKAMIGFGSGAAVIGIILLGPQKPYQETLDLYVGQPAPEDVFADVGFSYINEKETKKLRQEASQKVLPRYSFSRERLNAYITELKDFLAPPDGGDEPSGGTGLSASPKAETGGGTIIAVVDARDLESLKKAKDPAALAGEIATFLNGLGKDLAPTSLEVESAAKEVGENETGERYRLALLNVAGRRVDEWTALTLPRDRRMREAMSNVLNALCGKAIDYDDDLTNRERAKVEGRIAPVISKVQPGSKIIDRGYEVDPLQVARYRAYVKKREELNPEPMKMRQRLYYALGLALLIAMFLIASRRYLRIYQKNIYKSNSALLMLSLIVLGALFLSRAITFIPFATIQSSWNNIFYYLVVVSIPMAAIMMTLLLNRRVALFFAVLAAAVVGIMKNFSLSYAVVSAVGGIIAVYSSIGVRRRTQLIRAGATIALANLITIGAIDAIADLNIVSPTVGYRVAGGFLAGMLSAFIAASLLPLFEYVFNMVTDISLLELSDLNHPLLKKMFVGAPGTYHHSLMVGNLAEAAAEMVGANPLRVRVCAYFHDIGKLKKPEYYTENELHGKSKHEELNPQMSGLIIRSHVKDGVDTAIKNKLNRMILSAIREHHGTGLMYYFYDKAKKGVIEGEEVAEEDYRYPGPKPESKETAILMLADAVEAASRSLDRPTPSRVRNLVREIINQRIIDGQLDECDLTFKDLNRIAESFERTLNGTFHTRVKYPDRETPEIFNAGAGGKPDKKAEDQ